VDAYERVAARRTLPLASLGLSLRPFGETQQARTCRCCGHQKAGNLMLDSDVRIMYYLFSGRLSAQRTTVIASFNF
jgi:hypothetical protein